MSESENQFVAYRIHPGDTTPVEPAPSLRQWMEDTDQRHAYRCLPLVMANQYGWVILNTVNFTAAWNGGPAQDDLVIEYWSGEEDLRVSSHFGAGVLTFAIPYLFRTPKGVNLWVKGPSNEPKDGIWPLEGIVETDWTSATFTMNWRFTRPDHAVHFAQGEPICMVVPVQRWVAENLEPCMADLASNPSLEAEYEKWHAGRSTFNQKLHERDPATVEKAWQKEYFQGKGGGGELPGEHQARVELKPFEKPKP